MHKLIEDSAKYISGFVKANNISFDRGNVEEFFYRLGQVETGIAIGSSSNEEVNLIKLNIKNLYSLWNIIVDDEIDNLKTKNELDATRKFLVGERNISTDSTKVLSEIISNFGEKNPEIFLNYLHKIINAFEYEYLINKHSDLVTKEEYLNTSTTTASIVIFCCVDIVFDPDISNYGKIRSAFDTYTKAIKLASDVGSGLRELIEERNLNYPIILLMEEDKLSLGKFQNLKIDDSILNKFIKHKTETINLCRNYQQEANTQLQKCTDEFQRISTTINILIDNYIQKDAFNNKLGS